MHCLINNTEVDRLAELTKQHAHVEQTVMQKHADFAKVQRERDDVYSSSVKVKSPIY